MNFPVLLSEEQLTFGVRLRLVRIRFGWSQDACAVHMGVHRTTWINWEADRTTPLPVYRAKISQLWPEL